MLYALCTRESACAGIGFKIFFMEDLALRGMAFAKLAYRDSLRDIVPCLRVQSASSVAWAFEAP